MPIDRAIANISLLLDEQSRSVLSPPPTDGSLRQMYEALLDAATEHIFLVTTTARIVYTNLAAVDATCAATGRSAGRDGILGQDMRDLNYPEWFLTPFLQNLAQAAGGKRVSAETQFPAPSGDVRTYEYTLSPIHGADGAVHIVVGITRDIHDRKTANRERQALLEAERAARQEAETAVRVRDDFLSTAAHDLKTPLTAAQGRAQLLLRQITRGGSLDIEKVEAQATAILSALTQMALQIDELQDIAFLQIGRPLELNTQSYDLTALVRRGVTRIAREDPNVRVDLDFSQEPIDVVLDQVRIERVLDNLLSNSFKYTGPDKTISIKVWEERDQAM
ncbi:MAG: PAS domain-containing sensor histidine kinase [Thermomicrobiales bacterium]